MINVVKIDEAVWINGDQALFNMRSQSKPLLVPYLYILLEPFKTFYGRLKPRSV